MRAVALNQLSTTQSRGEAQLVSLHAASVRAVPYVQRGSCNYAPASRIAAMGVESHNNS